MPGMIIDGGVESVPGLDVRSWQDDGRLRLRMGEDGRRRSTRWVRGICLHTTLGLPFDPASGGASPDGSPGPLNYPRILPGRGPFTDVAAMTNRWWSTNGEHGGAHVVADFDGSIACLADLTLEEAYHAGPVNEVSVGIEIAQRKDGAVYAEQLDAVARLCLWLTERLRIQRTVPKMYRQGIVAPRLAAKGKDVVGVYGHRDVTTSRGFGDPGDAIFARLIDVGFEPLDLHRGEDLDVWKVRQHALGVAADGIPGPLTAAAIARWQGSRHYCATGVLTLLEREELDRA